MVKIKNNLVENQNLKFKFEISSFPFVVLSKFYGQATKGTRWMPWHFEAMKDVASCDKRR
jgi:hypothetical protein